MTFAVPWGLLAAVFGGYFLIVPPLAVLIGKWLRGPKHPDQADTHGPGTSPVPGQPAPIGEQGNPALRAPAPDNYEAIYDWDQAFIRAFGNRP